MNRFSRTFVFPALAGALLIFSGCAHRPADAAANSAYAVNMVEGCAVEIDHRTYDAALPGFWFVGGGATIQFSRIKGSPVPASFSFMIRTKPDASKDNPSEIDIFKVLTPAYRIVTKFDPKKTAPVDILSYTEKPEGTEVVLVKTDSTGRYIRFERVGEYVKVTFTAEGLALIGDAAAISWKELPPGKKSDSEHSAAEAEGWRRVIAIKPADRPGF